MHSEGIRRGPLRTERRGWVQTAARRFSSNRPESGSEEPHSEV
jgi:hypothetical protein